MKFIKPLNEYANAEAENYEEKGLEGVTAKVVLLNLYPETLLTVIKDFDKQCKSDEFKNKNLDILRSMIGFYSKYHDNTKEIKDLIAKYNIK